jgi:hypothetical protein
VTVPLIGGSGGGIAGIGRGLGSALGTVSNTLDVPMAAGEAALADLGGAHGRLHQIAQDFQEGGGMRDFPGAVSNVAENDVYFRKGSLERVLKDPAASPDQKRTAQWFIDHPTAAGAADFITEFANPSNFVLGGAGRAASAVGRIPQVANTLDEAQAFSRIGSRFAGLRVAGRDVARQANPSASARDLHNAAQAAENWGRRIVNTGKKGDEEAYNNAMTIFRDLTADEQKEVVHRMQGTKPRDFGAKNATIDARAQLLGKSIWTTTRDQLKAGVLSPAKIYGRDEMFPGVFSPVKQGAVERGLTNPEEEQIAERARTGERPAYESQTYADTAHGTPDEIANAREHFDDQEARKAELNEQINERAEVLAKHLESEDPPNKNFTFFPMAGAFNEPGVDAEYKEFLDAHTGSGGTRNAVRLGTAAKSAPRRGYATLQEAEENSTRGVRSDWSPADAYYRFTSQRNKNVGFEEAMGDLVGMKLAKPEAERANGDHFANVGDVQAARMFGSPTLREQAVHQHVVTFLEEAGATKGDASAFATATSFLGRAARAFPKAYQTSQSLLRQSVIANPIIHAGWNLMGQYLSSGGDVRYLAGINKQLAEDAERYGAVTARGAPRTLGGGSAIADASRPYSDLNPVEKASRLGADAQEWNAKLVFDKAEKRYAEALFKTFVRKGMTPEEAGNRVRQSLGDYANVSNAGIDKVFAQAFFFYPWLKTILPFWVKNGLTKPQTWNPITQGLQTHNELAGDSNFGNGSEGAFTAYTGMSGGARPRPEYYAVPVVQRILDQIGNLVGGLTTNDQDMAKKGFKGLLLNRLNPAVAGGVGAGQALLAGTQQPTGALGYAPIVDRVKQAVEGLGDFVPAPVKAAYDAVNVLFGREELAPDVIAGELVGGTGYVGVTPQQKALESYLKAKYYRAIDGALKSGNKQQAWTYFQMMQKALVAGGLSAQPLVKNPEKPDEVNPMPVVTPENADEKEALKEPETTPAADASAPQGTETTP